MSVRVISATQASRTLSDILNKVHYQKEYFEIKRGKEIIAKIIPASPAVGVMTIGALGQLLKRLPTLDHEDSEAFEQDIKDIRSHMDAGNNPWD